MGIKIKLLLSYIIILFLVFFCFLPAGFMYADSEKQKEHSDEDKSLTTSESDSSNDIIVKGIDKAGFPKVSIYLGFKEGSPLGLTNLNESDFKVVENGKVIDDFIIEKVGETDEPIGVVLVLDTSGSMKGEPIDNAMNASMTFIDGMRDIDSIAVVGFDDDVEVHSNFTSDKQALKNSVALLEADGETALFDGIITGLGLFDSLEGESHRYMVVLSDGTDTVSNSGIGKVIDKASENDIIVYSIALISGEFNPSDLEKIAGSTGGELLQATDPEELTDLYSNISNKIRNQYKISYNSTASDAESYNVMISIDKMGMAGSITLGYENPFSTKSDSSLKQIEQEPEGVISTIIFNNKLLQLLIFLFIFVSVTVFIYVISTVFIPNRKDLKARTEQYIYNMTGIEGIATDDKENDKKGLFNKFSKAFSKPTKKGGFSDLFNQKLRRAGIKIQGSKFIFLHITSVVIITFAIFLATKNYLLTIAVIAIVIFAPFIFINFRINKKVKKFNGQLPDTLQLIEGALKAGYSLNQSISMVIKETEPPISEEFKITINEIRMGLTEKAALQNMAKRINSELFDWVVLAINIQREVGGNLAEIMDIIANTIREKERVLRQIKALTSEGKLSAYVLIALPILLGFALAFLNRDYINVLLTTKIGFMMLGLAAVLMIVGVIWILKIIRIDY